MIKNFLVSSLKKMVQIRTIENLFAEQFKKNNNSSFLHLSAGQEASAVGVCLALKKKDLVFGNHRSHGHYIAKGSNIPKMIFEVFGDKRGCCKGNGGSMHMLDKKKGFMGTTPILGSVAPISNGIALSLKMKKVKSISVAFLGDGASEEGAFYETLNIAALHKLPLLLIVEDNNYSVEVPYNLRKAKNYNLRKIVNGLSSFYKKIDGQDVLKVFLNTIKMRETILKYGCPAVLHLKVLRKYAHSGYNVDTNSSYRKEKESLHLKRDPIALVKKKINNTYKIDMSKINKIESQVTKQTKKIFVSTYNKICS